MTEQSPKNIWEIIPDFSQMWKREANENYTLVIEGLYASIASYVVTRKGQRYIHYLAMIKSSDFNLIPDMMLQKDTTSIVEAKRWSEQWLRHFYKYIQLQKQVECYEGWLKHYQKDNDTLRTKLHEYELQVIREQFRHDLDASLEQQGGEA